jgi:hypothetical protein
LTPVSIDPLDLLAPLHIISFKERALGESTLIEFCGRDRVHAQRKALDWWFLHRQALGLHLRDFLARCLVSDDQRKITFIRP